MGFFKIINYSVLFQVQVQRTRLRWSEWKEFEEECLWYLEAVEEEPGSVVQPVVDSTKENDRGILVSPVLVHREDPYWSWPAAVLSVGVQCSGPKQQSSASGGCKSLAVRWHCTRTCSRKPGQYRLASPVRSSISVSGRRDDTQGHVVQVQVKLKLYVDGGCSHVNLLSNKSAKTTATTATLQRLKPGNLQHCFVFNFIAPLDLESKQYFGF